MLRVRGLVSSLWREVAAFGVVGAAAFVVDNGLYNVFVFGLPGGHGGALAEHPTQASALATGLATLFSWVGNRLWTYRHTRRENVAHELALFVLVNVLVIGLMSGAVFVSRYVLGLDSVASDNAARLLGFGVGTVLRFWTYRRFVFVNAGSQAARSPAPSTENDDSEQCQPHQHRDA